MSFKIEIKPSTYALDADVYGHTVKETKPATVKKKRTKKVGDTEIVTAEDELPMLQSNVPYKETYQETDNILRTAIGELGIASAEIGEDLRDIRASKTLRKKYDYVAALQSSRATIISTMVSAAREMNNSIKNSHELELKRAKENKDLMGNQDDVKSIQDMYNAFVSMPVQENISNSQFVSPLGPMTSDLTLRNPNMVGFMPSNADPDALYNDYLNNMSPEQMTMLIEENPHINQIIAYDPTTGNATFEIYNSENGQFIQGVPKKSAEMFMNDMQFDFANMQAHSNNLNETYDIVYVNNGTPLSAEESAKLSNY